MAVIVPLEPNADKPKRLLDQARDVIRVNHYSARTEEAYVDWRVNVASTR